MITPSAQLTLTKGNKSWSSTAVAAALELVDPLHTHSTPLNHKKTRPSYQSRYHLKVGGCR